jgi:uncharacterized pyridoxamine 5'-phosphate oxidase family protein
VILVSEENLSFHSLLASYFTSLLIAFPLFQDCINRIITLEGMDRLSGVMDDRGKFIYISTEEMKAVADYIRKQGRVSISHLASNSNQFIDLEPKPQYNEESNLDENAAAGTEL